MADHPNVRGGCEEGMTRAMTAEAVAWPATLRVAGRLQPSSGPGTQATPGARSGPTLDVRVQGDAPSEGA